MAAVSPRYPRHKSFPLLEVAFERMLPRFCEKGESLESMREADRIAFVVMSFDGPLLNGGFQFWATEEHSFSNDDLIAVLDTLDARRCDYIKRLVREVSSIGELAARMEEEQRPDKEFNVLAARCFKMDVAYWLIRDEFLEDVEKLVERLFSEAGRAKRAKR